MPLIADVIQNCVYDGVGGDDGQDAHPAFLAIADVAAIVAPIGAILSDARVRWLSASYW